MATETVSPEAIINRQHQQLEKYAARIAKLEAKVERQNERRIEIMETRRALKDENEHIKAVLKELLK
mgnify:CR=1 FL=1